jgi:nicotinate-nucleotide pyrophosphorylase (carboxylating)
LELARSVLEETLKSYLSEDLGFGDITTDSLVDASTRASAIIICNEPATIAGLWEALALLEIAGCEGTPLVKEGDKVATGTRLLKASGPAASLLKVERTLLNLLSHMSGVATATSELVDLAKRAGRNSVRIACTRKTLPGLRYFEKRAVAVAGGDTHRLRLDDAVLIKDNHLSLAGTVTECVKRARSRISFTKKIEIEATEPSQAVEAAKAGADIILLDNMRPNEVERTVVTLRRENLREGVVLEASGGIRKDNLAAYARTGVDIISVGMITHSAKSIDMSMNIARSNGKRG